jgi:RNA polymerase sigma-70 factor (family 1)
MIMDRADSLEAAYKELFHKEYRKLCHYALSYVQDSHLAEDVVQDTFIKIWEQKKDLIQSPNIKYYLITAVKNNSITAVRKQKMQRVQFTEETPEPEPEPFFTTRSIREDAAEQAKRVAEALDQLPPKCKEVFLLIKLHGMSYKQAAESLDLSVKTIENQMGKAIKILRELAVSPAVLAYLLIMLKKFGCA